MESDLRDTFNHTIKEDAHRETIITLVKPLLPRILTILDHGSTLEDDDAFDDFFIRGFAEMVDTLPLSKADKEMIWVAIRDSMTSMTVGDDKSAVDQIEYVSSDEGEGDEARVMIEGHEDEDEEVTQLGAMMRDT